MDIIHLSNEGEVEGAIRLSDQDTNRTWKPMSFVVQEQKCLLTARGLHNDVGEDDIGGLFLVNLETNACHGIKSSNNPLRPGNAFFLADEKIAINYDLSINNLSTPNQLSIAILDGTLQGLNTVWRSNYQFENENNIVYFSRGIKTHVNGDLLILGQGFRINNDGEAISFLLSLDQNGEIGFSLAVQSDQITFLNHVIDSDGNIYIVGSITESPVWSEEPVKDGFIMKLDADFAVSWVKRLSAAYFVEQGLEVALDSDENIVFAYTTDVDLPVITGKISPQGILLGQRALPFFNPKISINNLGDLFFASGIKYDGQNDHEFGTILAKTNELGQIEGCIDYPACLTLIDLELLFYEIGWVQDESPPLESISLQMESVNYITESHCSFPSTPSPFFVIPDSTCVSDCLVPLEINNRFAHHVEWQIISENVDSIITDTSFIWCFLEPGEYTISQKIWLFGCEQYYEETIVVLPELLLPLDEDRFLCTDDAFELEPISSRPLIEFEWSDGTNNPTFMVTESGIYSIVASDGYCSVKDTVRVTQLSDWLDGEPLQVPNHIQVCENDLPYLLYPISTETSSFILEPLFQEASFFELTNEGVYSVIAQVEDCEFRQEVFFEVSTCDVPIYLPNVFSPNNDGVNDFVEPQGKDFTGHRLAVYDRWGGLLFQAAELPFRWDGRAGNQLVPSGVYVLVFYYRNELTQQEEMKTQNILLLR